MRFPMKLVDIRMDSLQRYSHVFRAIFLMYCSCLPLSRERINYGQKITAIHSAPSSSIGWSS